MLTCPLPRSNPEEQGVLSANIIDFLKAADSNQLGLHSIMFLRHGHIIAEGWWAPYRAEEPHLLYSLSKSFVSTAVGFAVSEKLMTVDDLVVSYFPEIDKNEVADQVREMRIRHLLTMSTGHSAAVAQLLFAQMVDKGVGHFLSVPLEYEPGTRFVYNSGASYMLSAIIQKAAGVTLMEYLQPRLFDPLGITGATWDRCPRGISLGAAGLNITTEDIAKFGQLYLQKGICNGNRLISEAWVEEATSFHVSTIPDQTDIDKQQGYGYQFYLCRHGGFTARGAKGQFCIVLPNQDAVIVMTAGTSSMQAVLDLVWTHLLPAMKENGLPGHADDQSALKQTLLTLQL